MSDFWRGFFVASVLFAFAYYAELWLDNRRKPC